MDDLIKRQDAIDALGEEPYVRDDDDDYDDYDLGLRNQWRFDVEAIKAVPSAQPEIIRCTDCIFGHLCIDVQNGVEDSWIECRNPEGLNRDVSTNGYCSASIRKM